MHFRVRDLRLRGSEERCSNQERLQIGRTDSHQPNILPLPRSETVKLTKTARERFDRQLAEKLPDIFTALFEAGTKEKDTAALSLLVNRAVPVRKGVPVNFKTRPLSNPTECADAFGDILAAIGSGELTPDEGNMIGALIERRANLFQTVELQDEIAKLKAQIAGIVVTPPCPALHVVERP